MCGTSAFGLVSKYSLPLEALSKLAWSDGEVNDGMVGLHSCQVHTLGKSYEDAFYEACKIPPRGACSDACSSRRMSAVPRAFLGHTLRAAINHVDATGVYSLLLRCDVSRFRALLTLLRASLHCSGRNGNGDFNDATRQPVKWYSMRT